MTQNPNHDCEIANMNVKTYQQKYKYTHEHYALL